LRRTESFRAGGPNSLWNWSGVKNPFRVAANFILIYSARYLPSLRLKNFLYRLAGARVGRNVSVGLGAVFDVFFPELIEVGDNSVIGYNSTILAHEFLVREWRKGRVVVGKNVLIGANSLIMPGVRVGDGATVAAFSLVNRDVPANAVVGGVPAKKIKARKGR